MARWEQFEVWIQNGSNRWEMIAAFSDFEIASVVARNRSSKMRLVHAIYENGKVLDRDVLAEVGATRTA